MRLQSYQIAILVLVLFLAGCFAGLGGKEEASYPEEAEADYAVSEKRMAGGADAPAAATAEREALGAEGPATGDDSGRAQETRKRIFTGFGKLLVDDVETGKREIAHIAEGNGGYVESVYQQTIIVRVPAERFQELFQRILEIGEIVYKSVETYDVTEYFRDQEARLRLAQKTRERLYALLDKTDDVDERLKILREIKRLSEEIERISLSLELLERQVAYSRITVELIARLPQARIDKGNIPFSWIANLDPLYPSLGDLKPKVSIQLGADFAVFEKEKRYRAESAEGTRIRIGSTRNDPRGDSEFWQKALLYHLGAFYKTARSQDLGPFRAVLFSSKDAEPFYYLVAVAADRQETIRKELIILEIFFPDKNVLDRRLESLQEAIREIEIKK